MKSVLTVAGSDSGGGAGIQGDLKTMMAFGVYGTSAVTALTAQNTLGVDAIQTVPSEFVEAQIDAVMTDMGCDAFKTGMLSSEGTIKVVANAIRRYHVEKTVVDPVGRTAN